MRKLEAYALYESEGHHPAPCGLVALDKLVAMNNEGATAAQAESKAVFETTRTWGVIAISFAFCVSAVSATADRARRHARHRRGGPAHAGAGRRRPRR